MRIVHWLYRAQLVRRAMKRADADIYLQMGAGVETGLVAYGKGRLRNRSPRFVFCLAHDSNYGLKLKEGILGVGGKLYKYGLRRADLIVSQTMRQQEGLRKSTGLDSIVIPLPAATPVGSKSERPANQPPLIVWAARIVPVKRLELLLEVARLCPELSFEVAGTPNSPSPYAEGLYHQAATLPNVRLLGRLNSTDMHTLYQRADILCNTSISEGFPTTFLEAWSYGIPVVSTFDSDNIVANSKAGIVSGNPVQLARDIRELLSSASLYESMSRNARTLFFSKYSIPVVSRQFLEQMFEHLLQ